MVPTLACIGCDCASPVIAKGTIHSFGLSKRELIAALALQGLLSTEEEYLLRPDECDRVAQRAVHFADALIHQLNEIVDPTSVPPRL